MKVPGSVRLERYDYADERGDFAYQGTYYIAVKPGDSMSLMTLWDDTYHPMCSVYYSATINKQKANWNSWRDADG